MGKTLTPATLVEGLGALASPPTTYSRVVQAIEDPFSSAQKIAHIVGEDPDLTVRLLRLVNSSYYGFPRKIETVSHAVALIGNDQLRDLTLATTCLRSFKNVPASLCDMESFWRHSVACGLIARLLSYRRREPNPERFFVAGLLHDIGRLVLYLTLPDESRAVLEEARKTGCLLYEVERRAFRFDHADVGAALLEAWELPESLRSAVHSHHNLFSATSFPAEVAAVHLADVIANALSLGSSGEIFTPPLEGEAWEVVGLPVDSLSSVLRESEELFHSVVGFVVEMAS